jgi:hypothetical protein
MVKFTKRVLSPQEFTFPTIVGVGENNTIPIKFELFQNYPNPFNPSTNITFSLFAAATVKLQIFDMIGREVGVIVDGYMPAGTSTVEFKAPHVSSGLYVYRFTLDGQASSKKMLFIK